MAKFIYLLRDLYTRDIEYEMTFAFWQCKLFATQALSQTQKMFLSPDGNRTQNLLGPLYEARISYPPDSGKCNLRKTRRRAVKLRIWTLQ